MIFEIKDGSLHCYYKWENYRLYRKDSEKDTFQLLSNSGTYEKPYIADGYIHFITTIGKLIGRFRGRQIDKDPIMEGAF